MIVYIGRLCGGNRFWSTTPKLMERIFLYQGCTLAAKNKLRDLSNEKQICTPLKHKSGKKNNQLDSQFIWFIFNNMSKYHRGYVRTYSDMITRDMKLLRREEMYYKTNKIDWALIFFMIFLFPLLSRAQEINHIRHKHSYIRKSGFRHF